MIYTGVDGDKTYSIDYSFLKKRWSQASREGRRIYVIPSDKCIVIHKETEIRDLQVLKKTLALEFEERFGGIEWDVKLKGSRYCAVIFRDFKKPQDAYALDSEIHALVRSAVFNEFTNGYILDIGRRKTTLIRLEKGELEEYRVILKGGNFIEEEVSRQHGQDAPSVIREKGLEDGAVKKSLESILGIYLEKLGNSPVFLSGGWSRLRGIDSLFGRVYRNRYVRPELNSAFGSAIKYVVSDCAPDFRTEGVSEKELKRYIISLGFAVLVLASSLWGIKLAGDSIIRHWREEEKKLFSEKFPGLPAVAVRDQVKAFSSSNRFPLLKKMNEFSVKLQKGLKIYSFEYTMGVLKVKGEGASKEVIDKLSPKKVKKTPSGTYEFEVEIK